MMKSKRNTIVFENKFPKFINKLDSDNSWYYHNTSKNLGIKYKSTNYTTCSSNYLVTKGRKQGAELVDV